MAWLEQRKNGACWYACWKYGLNKVRRSTGVRLKVPGRSVAAQKKLAYQVAQAMEQVARGASSVEKACDAIRRVAELCGFGSVVPSVSNYIRSFPSSAGNSGEYNRRRAFHTFLSFLGKKAGMRLDCVTPELCRDFIRWDLSRVTRSTVGLHKRYISALFKRAVEVDAYVLKNPMIGINLAVEASTFPCNLRQTGFRRKPFSLAEIRYMMHHFPAPWADMVAVCWYTAGLRLSDVCLLSWDSIDWENNFIHLVEKKTHKERYIPLIPELHSILLRLQEQQHPPVPSSVHYVFPRMARYYTGGALASTYASERFVILLRQHGILPPRSISPAHTPDNRRRNLSEKSFHSIRHTVVSYLRSGISFSPDVIRDAVGHASEAVERVYYSSSLMSRHQVCAALAAALTLQKMQDENVCMLHKSHTKYVCFFTNLPRIPCLTNWGCCNIFADEALCLIRTSGVKRARSAQASAGGGRTAGRQNLTHARACIEQTGAERAEILARKRPGVPHNCRRKPAGQMTPARQRRISPPYCDKRKSSKRLDNTGHSAAASQDTPAPRSGNI